MSFATDYHLLLQTTADGRRLLRQGIQPAHSDQELARIQRKFALWWLVPCRNELHVVAISQRGRLALIDHSPGEVCRWRNFADLGGVGDRRPACLTWLTILEGDCLGALPPYREVLPPALAQRVAWAQLKRLERVTLANRRKGL